MHAYNVTEARKLLYKLLFQVVESHEPVEIHGKKGDAVLLAKEDWDSIQETLFLVAIPKMRESIIKGMKAPLKECSKEVNW